MKNNVKKIILGLMGLSLLTACSETPMEKLQKDFIEPSISQPFWAKEVKDNSDLWKEALSYCRANPRKVNCVPLRRAWGAHNQSKIIHAGRTKDVVYGSNPDNLLHSY
jgi:hypothetical protein